MQEHLLFHLAFLGQILLLSFYFPRKILERIKYVLETYPRSNYPKLYPKPLEHYERARRNYRLMNSIILFAGLILLAVLLGYPRSGKWDHAIATWYFMAQIFPILLIEIKSFQYYKLMRKANAGGRRKAELHPRRLFDFISPAMLGLTILVYFAFVGFIIYIDQFGFPWFGGYWNIVGITGINLFFTGIIGWHIYGQKMDPHQAFQDRRRQIELIAKSLVLVSIAATLKIAIVIGLAAFELRHLQPFVTSLYLQLIALLSTGILLRYFRVEDINFEVYKEDSIVSVE